MVLFSSAFLSFSSGASFSTILRLPNRRSARFKDVSQHYFTSINLSNVFLFFWGEEREEEFLLTSCFVCPMLLAFYPHTITKAKRYGMIWVCLLVKNDQNLRSFEPLSKTYPYPPISRYFMLAAKDHSSCTPNPRWTHRKGPGILRMIFKRHHQNGVSTMKVGVQNLTKIYT